MKDILPLSVKEQIGRDSEGEPYLECYLILDKDGNCIAQVMGPAEEMVRACNAYTDMYEALKDHCDSCKAVIDMFFGDSNACEFCDFGKVLAKAEGQAHD